MSTVSSSIPQGNVPDSGRVAAPVKKDTTPRAVVPEPKQAAEAQPTSANLQHAVDSINKSFKQSDTNVEFSVDHDTKENVVKMVDSSTGKVIRQYPSEVALAISKAIDQGTKQGTLLNQKA